MQKKANVLHFFITNELKTYIVINTIVSINYVGKNYNITTLHLIFK